MIVTVTLNPALRVSYEAQRVSLGSVNQVSRVRHHIGGRGLAVARILHTFGHEVVAAGLAGGASGEVIRTELAKDGVATQFTWITAESRRVLEVTDESSGAVTTFREPAPFITTEELGRLAADYRSLMVDATAAVLCGSLPVGLPDETYATLATYAAEANVPVVLDAGESSLRLCASRRPTLIIPEMPVPGRGRPPETKPPAQCEATDPAALVACGAGAVAVVSGDAVRVVTADGGWRAWLGPGGPAPVRGGPGGPDAAGDLVSSRDALVAGLVPGIVLGWSWPEALRHAVALAVAESGGEVDLDAYERLLPKVVVAPSE